jgi:type II secretory pathway predicted ATPase ExeA
MEPAFLPFFGMKRAPFLSLSSPADMFHTDQSALLRSHLEAATRKPDSIVVVLGADRIGKTTLLNEYVAGLADETCYATFDETCVEAIQFLRSFLEQIGLGEVVGTLNELQHITSEYLVHQARHGQHAVLFVDNAHQARPAVLEQLRWIADVRCGAVRNCSMVLAGNLSFQRIMGSPAMRSLAFHHQTSFHIRAFSEGETDDYIRHRLGLAGAADAVIFPDDARALIHRFTGGNPSMINVLCNEVLSASCAQGTRVVTEQRVRSAAEALGMPPHVVPIRGKGRRKSDPLPVPPIPDGGGAERMLVRQPAAPPAADGSSRAPLLQDVGIRELLVRITELSGQLEKNAAEEKRRALMDAQKHDKDVSELRAQLAAQVEQTASLARTLDDKAREIGKLQAALLDSERLRQEAARARLSQTDVVEALRAKLEAGHSEIEKLQAREDQFASQVDGLKRDLAETRAAVADRDATIGKLAAGIEHSDAVKSRGTRSTRDAAGGRRKQRRLTRRARSLRGNDRPPATENPPSPANESIPAVEPPRVEPDAGVSGTGKTETLIPQPMTGVAAGARAAAAAEPVIAVELFLDGKPWKVVDLAGLPPRMMVGRAEDCDVRLDSKYVSRHHAILVQHEGKIAIEDLRSSNGIFVNTRKVSRCDLRPGDTVTIGNVWLRISQG